MPIIKIFQKYPFMLTGSCSCACFITLLSITTSVGHFRCDGLGYIFSNSFPSTKGKSSSLYDKTMHSCLWTYFCKTCIKMKTCCQKLVHLGTSHQSVFPMSTFHTPPLGITQHNDGYFVASWICKFCFCFLDCKKFTTDITVNKLLPNP